MTGRRGSVWAAAGLGVAVPVAGAALAPSSWWGVAFAGAVLAAMLGLRRVVRESYRVHWTRTVVVVALAAVCAGGVYAFAVAPFGPSGVAYAFAAPLLFASLWVVKDAAQTQGTAAQQEEWHRTYMSGGRRR